MNLNLGLLTKQVANLSRAVGMFLKEESEKINTSDVEEKSTHNLVTYVDKEAESRIVAELKKILPQAGFIAEEDASLKKSDRYNWVIDPLDGTTNFVHGVPVYCISIALLDYDEVVSGVVMEVNLKECFYTWKGASAYLNGKEITVSESKNLDSSLLATGFPYYDYSLLDSYLELFKDLMKSSRGLRRLGSAAADLAYVACGRFDAFYEYGLQPWDVAAGALLVINAGGTITDFNGEDDFIFGKHLVATNGFLHNAFMDKVKRHFPDKVSF